MATSDSKTTLENLRVGPAGDEEQVLEDEFLTLDDLVPVRKEALQRALQRTLAEIEELFRDNRWEDALALMYPVHEKVPELVEAGLELELRAQSAFALGHLNRFDEAIRELLVCTEKDPESFRYHSSLAYTAYNSLYAASNKEIFLRGKRRQERIALAHKHFKRAQELRPEGITNFYREGMLYKQIEKKSDKSIPLFEKAIQNWEMLEDDARAARAQERKNYVKSLYQLSSALLDTGDPSRALEVLKRCLAEDEQTEYVSAVYKYFALGKVHFFLNEFNEARQALEFALSCGQERSIDFIYELLARTYLAMGNAAQAQEVINKVPEKRRRPFVRWTEADVLCDLKQFQAARRVLLDTAERDRRSAHKAYIRLARIEYLLGNHEKSREYAESAAKFFLERWGGFLDDAAFWDALNSYKLGEYERAEQVAMELKKQNPRYPKLALLVSRLAERTSL